MDFTRRQASYYSEATEALGLIERKRVRRTGSAFHFELSTLGEDFVASRPDERNRILAEQMMKLPTMRLVFDSLLNSSLKSEPSGGSMSVDDIAVLIGRESHLSGSTPRRRASTILSWFQWIGENYGVVDARNRRLSFHRHVQSRLMV
jgi:hypothetical protein